MDESVFVGIRFFIFCFVWTRVFKCFLNKYIGRVCHSTFEQRAQWFSISHQFFCSDFIYRNCRSRTLACMCALCAASDRVDSRHKHREETQSSEPEQCGVRRRRVSMLVVGVCAVKQSMRNDMWVDSEICLYANLRIVNLITKMLFWGCCRWPILNAARICVSWTRARSR